MDGKDATNANILSSAETYDEAGVEQIYLAFLDFFSTSQNREKSEAEELFHKVQDLAKVEITPPSLHSFIIFVRLQNGSHNFTVVYASV